MPPSNNANPVSVWARLVLGLDHSDKGCHSTGVGADIKPVNRQTHTNRKWSFPILFVSAVKKVTAREWESGWGRRGESPHSLGLRLEGSNHVTPTVKTLFAITDASFSHYWCMFWGYALWVSRGAVFPFYLFIYLFFFFSFYFWLHLWHVEVPRPGTKPMQTKEAGILVFCGPRFGTL